MPVTLARSDLTFQRAGGWDVACLGAILPLQVCPRLAQGLRVEGGTSNCRGRWGCVSGCSRDGRCGRFHTPQLPVPFSFATRTLEVLIPAPLTPGPGRTPELRFFTHKTGDCLLRDFEGVAFLHQAVPPGLHFSLSSRFLHYFCLLFCNSAFSLSPSTPWPQTGTMFACLAFLETLGGITAVSTFNGIYSVTVVWYKGFVFLLSAVLLLIPAISLWYVITFYPFIKG